MALAGSRSTCNGLRPVAKWRRSSWPHLAGQPPCAPVTRRETARLYRQLGRAVVFAPSVSLHGFDPRGIDVALGNELGQMATRCRRIGCCRATDRAPASAVHSRRLGTPATHRSRGVRPRLSGAFGIVKLIDVKPRCGNRRHDAAAWFGRFVPEGEVCASASGIGCACGTGRYASVADIHGL